MSILITGGTGFIGSYLAHVLVQREKDKVVLFDYFPNMAAVRDLGDRVTVLRGDFSEATEFMAALKQHDVRDIFHLGYLLSESERYPAQAIRVNCDGTNRVFECARIAGVRRVVWASSGAVYGHYHTSANPQWLTEKDPPTADSVYGACKLFNENIAEVYRERYGFDHAAFRFCSVYGLGRGQRRSGSTDVYSTLVEKSLKGEPVIAPPADHLLSWGYVEDAAGALHAAYKAPALKSRVFNFTGEPRPVRDAVERLKELLPKAKISYGTEGVRHIKYMKADLLREELGFTPRVSMRDGLADYVRRLEAGERGIA